MTPSAVPGHGEAFRPEARSFVWSKLSNSQKEAGKKAIALIESAAKAPWQPRRTADVAFERFDFLPYIDANRRSGVVLLDGGRGCGKTSLLLTLLQYWSDNVRQRPQRGEDAAPIDDKLPVVPLGLIDLHQLRPGTSLILHVTLSLRRVMQSLSAGRTSAESPAAWSPHAESGLESVRRWDAFFRTIVGGWDTNLEQRKARLDLETYGVELEQSATEELTIGETFTYFVDALVKDYAAANLRGASAEPVFVISIDDSDMNPSKLKELLELLPLLNHPRIVFLLTGYTELFQLMLRRQYEKALLPPAALLREPERQVEVGDETPRVPVSRNGSERHARRLADQVYSKTIPPQQRCELKALTLEERVQELIRIIKLRVGEGGPREKLADSLDSLFRDQLSTARCLPERFRKLEDLANWIASYDEKRSVHLRLAEVAEYLWKFAVASTDSPSYLAGAVTLRLMHESRLVHSPLVFGDEWKPDVATEVQLIDEVISSIDMGDSRRRPGLRFSVHTSSFKSQVAQYHDPDKLLAAWSFAKNVQGDEVMTEGSSARRALLVKRDVGLDFTHGLVGLELATKGKRAQPPQSFAAWPFPRWTKASETERMYEAWSRHLSGIQHELTEEHSDEQRVEAYVSIFFHSVFWYLCPKQRDVQPSLTLDWVRIVALVVALKKGEQESAAIDDGVEGELRRRAAEVWAQRGAPLLLTPYLGLPTSTAARGLRAFAEHAGVGWRDWFKEAYQDYRESETSESWGKSVEQNARRRHHPWFVDVDPPQSGPERAGEKKAPAKK